MVHLGSSLSPLQCQEARWVKGCEHMCMRINLQGYAYVYEQTCARAVSSYGRERFKRLCIHDDGAGCTSQHDQLHTSMMHTFCIPYTRYPHNPCSSFIQCIQTHTTASITGLGLTSIPAEGAQLCITLGGSCPSLASLAPPETRSSGVLELVSVL